jgi:hypothetical protein
MSHLKPVDSREPNPHGGVKNEELSGVEGWILPYLRDSTLWPVLVVVIAHVVPFIAPMLLLAIRDLRVSAMGALLVIAYVTFAGARWEVRNGGRLGALSAVLAVTWAVGAIVAYVADRNALF